MTETPRWNITYRATDHSVDEPGADGLTGATVTLTIEAETSHEAVSRAERILGELVADLPAHPRSTLTLEAIDGVRLEYV